MRTATVCLVALSSFARPTSRRSRLYQNAGPRPTISTVDSFVPYRVRTQTRGRSPAHDRGFVILDSRTLELSKLTRMAWPATLLHDWCRSTDSTKSHASFSLMHPLKGISGTSGSSTSVYQDISPNSTRRQYNRYYIHHGDHTEVVENINFRLTHISVPSTCRTDFYRSDPCASQSYQERFRPYQSTPACHSLRLALPV
ncbi:hypothetical protein K523DRAFT_25910 [Schizophyllum commune Tattone D]|nr:hypothetical protein K523DRAFT_25910 [Schizophyllum commune Tattone D]